MNRAFFRYSKAFSLLPKLQYNRLKVYVIKMLKNVIVGFPVNNAARELNQPLS